MDEERTEREVDAALPFEVTYANKDLINLEFTYHNTESNG